MFSTNLFLRLRDPEFRRFIKFLIVGGFNTLFGCLIYAVLILIGLATPAAIVLATLLGVLFNYMTTGGVVFHDRSGRLWRFAAVYVVQMGINIAGVTALERVGVHPLIGGLVVLPVLVVFTFLAMRRFVFT